MNKNILQKFLKPKNFFLFLRFFFVVIFLFLFLYNNSLALDAKTLKETGFGLKGNNGLVKKIGLSEESIEPIEIAGNIIGVALSLLGIVFVFLIINGGYNWMMAGGDDSKSSKAKETFLNATIGLTIVFSAYVLTKYMLQFVF